jgi:formate hydrogenlyase subunit 3/multisubunit Na+/H+ antiporter MnhD subunit
LAIFLFSLTGLPPMAGFVGKWYIFQAAVGAGYTWLASIMVIASVISAFYYLRPIVMMYMAEPSEDAAIEVGSPTAIAVGVSALVIVSALLLSTPLISAARASALGGPVMVSQELDEESSLGEGRMFMSAPGELDERMKDKADQAENDEAATGSDAP